jgi:hypothetical protein
MLFQFRGARINSPKLGGLNDALRNPFFFDAVGVTDGAGARSDLLGEFPYLGSPHRAAAARRAA